jgi:hypothetical protein
MTNSFQYQPLTIVCTAHTVQYGPWKQFNLKASLPVLQIIIGDDLM